MRSFFYKFECWTYRPKPMYPSRTFFREKKIFWRCVAPSARSPITLKKRKLNYKSSLVTRYTMSVMSFDQNQTLGLQPVTILRNSMHFFSAKISVQHLVLSCIILLRNKTWILSHTFLQGTRGMCWFFYKCEGWGCNPWPSWLSRLFQIFAEIFSIAHSYRHPLTFTKQKLNCKSSLITRYKWSVTSFDQKL